MPSPEQRSVVKGKKSFSIVFTFLHKNSRSKGVFNKHISVNHFSSRNWIVEPFETEMLHFFFSSHHHVHTLTIIGTPVEDLPQLDT